MGSEMVALVVYCSCSLVYLCFVPSFGGWCAVLQLCALTLGLFSFGLMNTNIYDYICVQKVYAEHLFGCVN